MVIPAISPRLNVRGTKVPSARVQRLVLNRSSGSTQTTEWTGTAQDVAGLIPNAQYDELQYERDGELGKLTLTAIDSVSETLELDSVSISGSIFKNPYFASISAARIRAINQAAEFARNPDSTEAQIAAKIGPVTANNPNGLNLVGIEVDAYNMLLAEITDYEWEVPTAVWTRTVTRTSGLQLNVGLIGTVVATASLSARIGTSVFFQLQAGAVPNLGVPPGFTVGWRLRMKVNFIANGATQIIESYQFGAYNDILYATRA